MADEAIPVELRQRSRGGLESTERAACATPSPWPALDSHHARRYQDLIRMLEEDWEWGTPYPGPVGGSLCAQRTASVATARVAGSVS